MFKLLKNLKPYILFILLTVVIVGAQSILNLQLPNIMSKIVGEGVSQVTFETKDNGDPIVALTPKFAEKDGKQLNAIIPSGTYSGLKLEKDVIIPVFAYAYEGEYVPTYKTDANGNVLIKNISEVLGFNTNMAKTDIMLYPSLPALLKSYVPLTMFDRIFKFKEGENIDFTKMPYIEYETEGSAVTPVKNPLQNYSLQMGTPIPVMQYVFKKDPGALELDAFGNAILSGFYTDENGKMITAGEFGTPTMKFKRVDENFGELRIDKKGNSMLKQSANLPFIWKQGGLMLLITLIISICATLGSYLAASISFKFSRDVRGKLFRKINTFSPTEMNKFGTASLITRSTNDITQVQMFTMMMLRMLIMTPIMFAGGIIMALKKNVEMTQVLLYSLPIIVIVVFLVAVFVLPLFNKMQKKLDTLTLVARENLTGVRVIRAFSEQETETKRFDEANAEVTRIAIKANRTMSVMMPAMTLIMSFTSLGVVLLATLQAKNSLGSMSYADFGNIMAVLQYIMQIMMSLVMFSMLFVMFPRASASAVRINEVIETNSSILDKPDIIENSGKLRGELEFKNVTFKFPGADMPALKNISFKAKKGDMTAIIGSTGSGKSTIINLIPRFYDTTEGEVTIDGVNVQDMAQDDLRKRLAFVPQQAMLFSGTIAENIRYGKEDATDEEIEKAARIAEAYDFISQKPDKFNEYVEQGGGNFSGGQKQRLAIARAVVRNAEILVFDDSFSALDFKTDAKLRENLKRDAQDCTILVVAQRIGSIMNADNILVLDNGQIVGSGKHADLMENCEVYREIALSQLSADELK